MYVEGLDSNGKIKMVFSLFVYGNLRKRHICTLSMNLDHGRNGHRSPGGIRPGISLGSLFVQLCPSGVLYNEFLTGALAGSPFRPFLTPSADKVNTYLRPRVVIT